MELYEYSAHELSEMLADSKVSSEELTKSVLGRAKATDDKIGAYITICEENALEKAREVDKKRGKEPLHPLAGIPIGIKDNISTKGILTTCASKMLYNYVPPFDAFVMNGRVCYGFINGKFVFQENSQPAQLGMCSRRFFGRFGGGGIGGQRGSFFRL